MSAMSANDPVTDIPRAIAITSASRCGIGSHTPHGRFAIWRHGVRNRSSGAELDH